MMAVALLLLQCLFLLPSALAGVICEELPQELCAFAISSTSKRCLLESTQNEGGRTEYQCRTSEAVVERMSDWIETDECVRACGVSRDSVGISSDSLMESDFAQKLCSQPCLRNCPNIVDLYFNLAAGEGVFLPDLCEAQQVNPRRSMAQILSSGAAPSPAAPLLCRTEYLVSFIGGSPFYLLDMTSTSLFEGNPRMIISVAACGNVWIGYFSVI